MTPARLALTFFFGSLSLSGCALFALGVYGEAQERAAYCDLPCSARHTCAVHFDPEDVCSVIVRMRAGWQGRYGGYPHDDSAGLTVEWVRGTDGVRAYLNSLGLSVAGETYPGRHLRVAYLPTDEHPKVTALRHEIGHVLLEGMRGDLDHEHERVEWLWVDGGGP